MRNAAFILLFVALAYAANSQRFSLVPQVGFENTRTKINVNDLSSFSPVGVKFTPQASLRLNYSSKQGHGFFIGAATSRSTVAVSFTDPEAIRNNFSATAGNLQVRMEGGYQFNSKPISLKRSSQASSPATEKKSCGSGSTEKKSCSSSTSSRCGSKTESNNRERGITSSKGTWMRIQPSVGLGYIPAVKNDIVTKSQNGQTAYQYNAGNWQTALIAGTGFEFGQGNSRKLTVGINYVRGLGNLDKQTLTTVAAGKTITTTMESVSAGWNVRVGVPLSLKARPRVAKKPAQRKSSDCRQYRIIYRCRN